MRIGWRIAALVLVVVASASGQEPAPGEALTTVVFMPVDLTGVWNLDEISSDDLAGDLAAMMKAMREQMGDQSQGGGMGGEEAMGGQSGNDGASGQHRPPAPGPARYEATEKAESRDFAKAMRQLLITTNGADIEIMDGTDETLIWTPGGPMVQREGPGGIGVDQAWWDGDVLVLSSSGGRFVTTRRLHLEDDGKTLIADVVVKASGAQGRLTARLVYQGF